MSQTSEITWFCSGCTKELTQKKKCPSCKKLTRWRCTKSGKTGLYNNLWKHRQRCNACNPMVEVNQFARKRKLDQILSGRHFKDSTIFDFVEQEPYSKWKKNRN